MTDTPARALTLAELGCGPVPAFKEVARLLRWDHPEHALKLLEELAGLRNAEDGRANLAPAEWQASTRGQLGLLRQALDCRQQALDRMGPRSQHEALTQISTARHLAELTAAHDVSIDGTEVWGQVAAQALEMIEQTRLLIVGPSSSRGAAQRPMP